MRLHTETLGLRATVNLHSPRSASMTRPAVAFAVTLACLIAEVIGGFITGSLALIAAAGHTATTLVVLGSLLFVSPGPIRGTRRESHRHSGFEIIVALRTAVVAATVLVVVLVKASQRFRDAPIVESTQVIVIATTVLVAKMAVIVGGILVGSVKERVSTHRIVGAAMSAGVILASVVISRTSWYGLDPIAGLAIAAVMGWLAGRALLQSIESLFAGRSQQAGGAIERSAPWNGVSRRIAR